MSSNNELSFDDDRSQCNHTCCKHCGYKEPVDYDGCRWKRETFYNVNGKRLYRKDLESLIESCCPKDKLKLKNEIKYCMEQDASEVLHALPSMGYKICLVNHEEQSLDEIVSSEKLSTNDESECCNHKCCRHCGFKDSIDCDGHRWKYEQSFKVNGERLYRKDLIVLIDSCCPKDKLKLSNDIKYWIEQDAFDILEDLSRMGCKKISPLNDERQTLIHLAFYKKAHNTLNYNDGSVLFKCYEDYENSVDIYGLSHLHVACVTGDTKIVGKFLDEDKDADINVKFSSDPDGKRTDFTPLHFAVSNECKDVVELLLQRGADLNVTDSLGRTPLHLACGVTETIDRCLEDIGLLKHLQSTTGIEITEMLLKYGGNVSAKDKQGNTPLFNCFQSFRKSKLKDFEIKVLKARQRKKFEILLNYGANVTVVNNNNENILHWIVKDLEFLRLPNDFLNISFYDTSHAELIEQLLAVNQELDVNATSKHGETPLQLAISFMSIEVIEILLKYNADFSSKQSNQKMPIPFIYPKIPPDLKAIRNMINMINILSDEEYYFTPVENLSVLRFMIHNCEDCECTKFVTGEDDNNDRYIIWNALYYGSPVHFEHVGRKFKEMLWFSKHRITLGLQGSILIVPKTNKMLDYTKFYMDCKKKLGLLDYENPVDQRFELCWIRSNSQIGATEENLDAEVGRMKKNYLESGTTLYKMMTESHTKIYKHVKNSKIDELSTKFVAYEHMIKAHVAKSLIRKYGVTSACQYFNLLSVLPIPDLCCNMITVYLSNNDIFNLAAAALIPNDS